MLLLSLAGVVVAREAIAQDSVVREPTLEQLLPGIYQVCEPSEPHPSGLQFGQCFRFEKMGDRQVAGIWFKAHTDSSICVGGLVEGNRLNGRAVSFLYDWEVPPTEADLQGGYTDEIGYFNARSPTLLEVNEPASAYTGYSATVLYREAALNTDDLVFTDLKPEFSMDNCLRSLRGLRQTS